MSELRIDTWTMPAAGLGAPSPFVPFRRNTANLVTRDMIDESIAEEETRYIGYGYVEGCLPYTLQDGYDRDRRERTFEALVLENDLLRATFLPELGGRLWSLWYKPQQRDLLFVNPVFQPANMGIRNAWFSGGVEWNFCWIGHTPLTCSSLFAGRTQLSDGTPVLRLWEWERVRQMAYQIDCWLPDGMPALMVRVRLVNPHGREVPVYWWSNAAVEETEDTRVIAPAEKTYRFNYNGTFDMRPYPIRDGSDRSYPLNSPHSGDYFFRIEEGQYPFVATADAAGRGMFHASTSRVIGRKLWVFGTGTGGRRWQEFLNTPGRAYIEIQGGLTRIQSECIPMPPRVEWDWIEAFGALETDPAVAHGDDWARAVQASQQNIEAILPQDRLEEIRIQTREMAEAPIAELLHRGSGWGALEARRRQHANEERGWPESVVFPDDTIEDEQQPWLRLLEEGVLPQAPVNQAPAAYMIQPQWREMLEQAVQNPENDHWLAWLHLGVMYLADKQFDQAREAWETSIAREPNAWAYRHLATLAALQEQPDRSAEMFRKAVEWLPEDTRLVIECGKAMVGTGHDDAWLDLLEKLPPQTRSMGRVRMLEARAALNTGDLDRLPDLLSEGLTVVDLREGETEPTRLWFDYHARRIAGEEGIEIDDALMERVQREFPPPKHLDFRMH